LIDVFEERRLFEYMNINWDELEDNNGAQYIFLFPSLAIDKILRTKGIIGLSTFLPGMPPEFIVRIMNQVISNHSHHCITANRVPPLERIISIYSAIIEKAVNSVLNNENARISKMVQYLEPIVPHFDMSHIINLINNDIRNRTPVLSEQCIKSILSAIFKKRPAMDFIMAVKNSNPSTKLLMSFGTQAVNFLTASRFFLTRGKFIRELLKLNCLPSDKIKKLYTYYSNEIINNENDEGYIYPVNATHEEREHLGYLSYCDNAFALIGSTNIPIDAYYIYALIRQILNNGAESNTSYSFSLDQNGVMITETRTNCAIVINNSQLNALFKEIPHIIDNLPKQSKKTFLRGMILFYILQRNCYGEYKNNTLSLFNLFKHARQEKKDAAIALLNLIENQAPIPQKLLKVVKEGQLGILYQAYQNILAAEDTKSKSYFQKIKWF
jgi:hypothetical protein